MTQKKPVMLFDKSLLQGIPLESLFKLKQEYYLIYEDILLSEINMDHEKNNYCPVKIARLFKKLIEINKLFYNYDQLRNKELNGHCISLKNNFFGFNKVKKNNNINPLKISINPLKISKSRAFQKGIKKASEKKFHEEDKKSALKDINACKNAQDILKHAPQIDIAAKNIDEIIKEISSWTLHMCREQRLVPCEKDIKSFSSFAKKDKFFIEYAPYSSFCRVLNKYFAVYQNKINSKKTRDKDALDWGYLYYLPFIDYLATNDKIHYNFFLDFKNYIDNKVKLVTSNINIYNEYRDKLNVILIGKCNY